VHIGRDVITRSANPVTPSCFTGLSSAHAQWHVNNSIRGGLFLCRTGSLNRRFAGLYLQKNLIISATFVKVRLQKEYSVKLVENPARFCS